MDTKKNECEEIINDIIDIEWFMLENVNASNPNSCQQKPKAFRLMRWMSHSVLPNEVLKAYLADLAQGIKEGRNFMTEKYARMENLIPVINTNPLIEKIVNIENGWRNELAEKYPELCENSGSTNFKKYMTSELESYSDNTIELYYFAVDAAVKENRNLVKERYDNMFKKLGYNSIEDKFKKN